MKKWLLIIFCIINIVPLFFILRFAFLFFTTTYDIFPEANQAEVETAVRRTLDLYGFKGDMKVTKFSRINGLLKNTKLNTIIVKRLMEVESL